MLETVFVYGTLKEGHSNNRLLDDKTVFRVGRASLEAPFLMVDLGAFPGIIKAPEDTPPQSRIRGELYHVSQTVFNSLDMLEGHPDFYKRERVDVTRDDGKAQVVRPWVYILPEEYLVGRDIIETGLWEPTEKELDYYNLSREEAVAAG